MKKNENDFHTLSGNPQQILAYSWMSFMNITPWMSSSPAIFVEIKSYLFQIRFRKILNTVFH